MVGAGMAGPRRGHRVEARGTRPSSCWRRATGWAAGCSRWSSSRTGGSTSAGSGSARPRTASYALAREHGAATFPTWTAGENVLEMGGRLVRYTRHDPAPSPARAGRRRPGDAAHRPDGGEGAARGSLGSAEGAAVGQPDDLVVDAPQHGDARPAGTLMEIAVKAVWAAMPADVSLPAPPVLRRLGRQARPAARHRGRRAAGPLRRGCGQAWPRRWARRLGDRLVLSAPVRRIEWTPDAARVHADGVEVRAQRVIVAVPPTLAGRHLVRPAAAGLPRPAHPAGADGRGDQVLRDLRRAVLARGGPERQRRQLGRAR